METLRKFAEKMKNNKVIFIILIIGMIFLIIPSGKKEKSNYDGEYEKTLNAETEKILSKIEGAGEVYVMISFGDRGKKFPVTDRNENGETINEKSVAVSGEIAIIKEEYPSVRGVVVVAEGGADERVKNDIIEAVSALTGAPIHNIEVFKLEG